jgi:hypothetical protein
MEQFFKSVPRSAPKRPLESEDNVTVDTTPTASTSSSGGKMSTTAAEPETQTTEHKEGSKSLKKPKRGQSVVQIRKLCYGWDETFPWLVVAKDCNNNPNMQCSYCLQFPTLAGNKSSFAHAHGGCTNFHIKVRTV